MAYEHNLFIPQGSDWTANVIFYTSNTTGRFTVDTSAYANGAGQLRKCYSSNAAANLTVQLVNPTDEPEAAANGIVILSLDNANTSSLADGRYLYDVEVITTGGSIAQVVRGTITIHPSMTRSWDWGE